jgi:hypothetical protein
MCIGAGADLAWQMIVEGKSLECVDWVSVATSALPIGKLADFIKLAKQLKNVDDAGATIKATRLAENVAKGAKGEAMTAAKLGDNVAKSQVTFKTSDGTRTRADFVTKNKGVVETKTGNAKLTPGQQKLHNDISAGREVTPVGKNAGEAGLTQGQPTKMNYCKVDRPC